MSPNSITWVGMDAHKVSIKVAALFPDRAEPVEWTEATTPEAIRRLARKLQREAPGEVRACYEAGPTGYGLQRLLEAEGVSREMIAPSLTPVRSGSHIKTVALDVINDLAVNRPGMAIDDVEVPEINYTEDLETGAGGWQPQGWLRTNNFVPQKYVVQLVSFGRGGQIEVSRLPVQEDNTARWDIPLGQLEKAIVVVSPMASKTTEGARYRWTAQEK